MKILRVFIVALVTGLIGIPPTPAKNLAFGIFRTTRMAEANDWRERMRMKDREREREYRKKRMGYGRERRKEKKEYEREAYHKRKEHMREIWEKGGGPPPWAPAHGYRRKHKRRGKVVVYREEKVYIPPFDLNLGRCNRAEIGAVLGGMAGGAIGSTVGRGDDRAVAAIGGTIIGVLIGSTIGREMDKEDRACFGQVLEHARTQEKVIWRDPDRHATYEVIPTRTYSNQAQQYCREYNTIITIGGRTRRAYGTACRQPDGTWKQVN